MKRTSYTLPEDLLEELRKMKETTDIPVSAIIRKALRKWLEENPKEKEQ
jgi:metal-responsive CopG/Arc/MetJ family transcriptional regulator